MVSTSSALQRLDHPGVEHREPGVSGALKVRPTRATHESHSVELDASSFQKSGDLAWPPTSGIRKALPHADPYNS